jgi:hypothetical protein
MPTLPVTSPPRDTYAEVVAFDNPAGWWAVDDVLNTRSIVGNPGPTLTLQTPGSSVSQDTSPILGEWPSTSLVLPHGDYLSTSGLTAGQPGDVNTLLELTFELWLKTNNASPAGGDDIITGPNAGSDVTYRLYLDGSGYLKADAKDGIGFTTTATSSAIAANTWYHVALVIRAGIVYIYLNGVQDAASAFTFAGFANSLDAGAELLVGPHGGSGSELVTISALAMYRTALSADRIAAHYVAGSQRGFASGFPSTQINQALDAIGSHTPRNLRQGTRNVNPVRMAGQSTLDLLRHARHGELPDGMLFIARDGTITLLDADHRSASPWNTVQATFGDAGGSELPYQDLTVDYSDVHLANSWTVTVEAGTPQMAEDATSIARYNKRSGTLTDLPLQNDSFAASVAASMLAKYAYPLQRITSITLLCATPAVTEAVFRRDLGDRIRILRTPPGGGARIDQTSFIQRIEVDADAHGPWKVVWGVSPV